MTTNENDEADPVADRKAELEARFGAAYAKMLEDLRQSRSQHGAFKSNDPEVLRELAIRESVVDFLPPQIGGAEDMPMLWDLMARLRSMIAPFRDAMTADDIEDVFTPEAMSGMFYTLQHVTDSMKQVEEWASFCNDKVNEIAQLEQPALHGGSPAH